MSNPSGNQPATSPPFDSSSHILHNLNQNSYFRTNDGDPRFIAQDLQAFQFALLPPNQHPSLYMGPPMHSLNNFTHLNNLNQYHPHPSSYPASLGQLPLANFAPGTVNPQLISSPPRETLWNQASFQLLSQPGSVQCQRTVLPLPQASRSARVSGSVQSYASLYTTLEPPFDQGSRPPEHTVPAIAPTQSTSNTRVFKAESSEDQSNDTSLQ